MPATFLIGNQEILVGLLRFLVWFVVWCPVVAFLEYATHRWIMHKVNRPLDPQLHQLKAHGRHHQGNNHAELVDMPLLNALRLTAPFFLAVLVWGFFTTGLAVTIAPIAALLSWCFLYVYLWNRMHRAIHRVEVNWFRRSGRVFRFFRRHHLLHHRHPRTNFGTVFPFTDYLLFTWASRRSALEPVPALVLPEVDAEPL